MPTYGSFRGTGSLPTRGAWIEIDLLLQLWQNGLASLPTRGAWIEIVRAKFDDDFVTVAPHTGSVD